MSNNFSATKSVAAFKARILGQGKNVGANVAATHTLRDALIHLELHRNSGPVVALMNDIPGYSPQFRKLVNVMGRFSVKKKDDAYTVTKLPKGDVLGDGYQALKALAENNASIFGVDVEALLAREPKAKPAFDWIKHLEAGIRKAEKDGSETPSDIAAIVQALKVAATS